MFIYPIHFGLYQLFGLYVPNVTGLSSTTVPRVISPSSILGATTAIGLIHEPGLCPLIFILFVPKASFFSPSPPEPATIFPVSLSITTIAPCLWTSTFSLLPSSFSLFTFIILYHLLALSTNSASIFACSSGS